MAAVMLARSLKRCGSAVAGLGGASLSTRSLSYGGPAGGLPPQTDLLTSRAKFTEAYCMIPRSVQRDIVTSPLPGWDKTRCWVLARPLSGFAETFSQYVVEVSPGGGSQAPEPEAGAEGVLFVLKGSLTIDHEKGGAHVLEEGGYAFLPPGEAWSCVNAGESNAEFLWVRKRYEPAPGIAKPEFIVASDKTTAPTPMPDSHEQVWKTTRFVDPEDLRHDMHCNVVTFSPGAVIPFLETHVMEHGLYVLEGKAAYNVNNDWIEVEAGDFLWLRAFCPQACYAGGPSDFRYLLYKDVNRHAKLP